MFHIHTKAFAHLALLSMQSDRTACLCFTGHGFLVGGTPPAGDPRPFASLLHQPGHPAAPGAQELRNEERRLGQVRLTFKHRQKPGLSWHSIDHSSSRVDFCLLPAAVHSTRSYIWKPSKHEKQISNEPLEIHIHLPTLHISLSKYPQSSFPSISPVPPCSPLCFYNLHCDQMKTSVWFCALH